MTKRMIKKLYTLYTVKAKYDDIKKDKNHKLVLYSSGIAECIKYHDSIVDWLNEIVFSNFKNGFGVKSLTEDGKNMVEIHRYDLECNTYYCNINSKDCIIRSLGEVINYYFNATSHYYEIKEDHIWIDKELTGHMYYGSPYESCDECGNCNGAKCDFCHEKFTVIDLYTDHIYYIGFDKDKAERIFNENKRKYKDILDHILYNYDISIAYDKETNDADYKSVLKILNENKIPYVAVN